MGSKNISVRDDIYRALRDAKGDEESFSDVIERLLKSEAGEHSLYGVVGMLDEDEASAVREEAAGFRESADEQLNRHS